MFVQFSKKTVLWFFSSTSSRANITLSGKKRRKLLKQLRHMDKEKASMDGRYIQFSVSYFYIYIREKNVLLDLEKVYQLVTCFSLNLKMAKESIYVLARRHEPKIQLTCFQFIKLNQAK